MRLLVDGVKVVFLSILIFFSVSFVTVFFDLNSPLHRQDDTVIEIGFPFVYYKQYMIGCCEYIAAGWVAKNLLLDIFITVITAIILYLLYQYQATKVKYRKSYI